MVMPPTEFSNLTWVEPDGLRRFNWIEISEQDKFWVNKVGQVHIIAEMDDDHRRNAAWWIIRNWGKILQDRAFWALMCHPRPTADLAEMMFDRELESAAWSDVTDWCVDNLPVVVALLEGLEW